MKTGLLIIASEVLDGKITDLNTKILADFLRTKHLELNESIVVRDEKEAIKTALKGLMARNDLILTSGGLGPTKDDITKETLGACFGRSLVYSHEAEQIAFENYSKFNRPFPGKEHCYSYLPEGFIPLSNSTGFAPAFYTCHEGKIIISGPGVPREFQSLLTDHFLKIVPMSNSGELLSHFIVKTKNVPEEKIFNEVDPDLWEKLEVYGTVSSLPILMGVNIGVKITAKNASDLASKIKSLREIIEASPIKQNIWHIGPESLEEKIVSIAREKKVKFGFAESATGGLCSHRITSVSGSSQCFYGSIISYDEQVKEELLGVSQTTLIRYSAVSTESAKEMAEGLRSSLKTDISISVTGYAGPGGGHEGHPVGTVCIGRAVQNSPATSEIFYLKGDREILKQRFSQAALYALLEELEKIA